MVKIYHFYHIFSNGKWKLPLSSHLSALKESKLINEIGSIKFGISGESRDEVDAFLRDQEIEFDILVDSKSKWEQQTLIPLHEFSKQNEGVVFYAHTKGASSSNSYSLSWRTSMTFFNVIQWQNNIEYLRNYDIVGCHWIDSGIKDGKTIPPFFGGNFWWANCSFISQLQKPNNENRWEAEIWLTSNFKNIFPRYKDVNPGWPKDENFVFGW